MTNSGTGTWDGDVDLGDLGTWGLGDFNIALKEEGKKRKRNYFNTGYSYLVTHPNTNPAEQGLTLLSGRDALLSLWYSDSNNNNNNNNNNDVYFLYCAV